MFDDRCRPGRRPHVGGRYGLAVTRPVLRGRGDLRRLPRGRRGAGSVVDRAWAGGSAMRLGIDVGATKTAAVAIDATGAVVHELRLPTAFGEEGVLATISAAIEGVGAATRLGGDGFSSVGIGI